MPSAATTIRFQPGPRSSLTRSRCCRCRRSRTGPPFAPPHRVVNLMEALRRSVAEDTKGAAPRKGASDHDGQLRLARRQPTKSPAVVNKKWLARQQQPFVPTEKQRGQVEALAAAKSTQAEPCDGGAAAPGPGAGHDRGRAGTGRSAALVPRRMRST